MTRSVYLRDGIALFPFNTSVRACIYVICEASYRIFYLFSFWYWWKSSGWLPTALLCYRNDFSFLRFVYYYSFLQCEYAPTRHTYTHYIICTVKNHLVLAMSSLHFLHCYWFGVHKSHSSIPHTDMQHLLLLYASRFERSSRPSRQVSSTMMASTIR